MSNGPIPNDITESEQQAGFQIISIENPEGHYALSAQMIPAVVCPIGPSDRVLKVRQPDGVVHYRHQRYGLWRSQAEDEEPKWLPAVGNEMHFLPEDAVAAARSRLGEECETPIVIKVPGE